MAQFSYKARRRSGEVVQGVLDVADRAAALLQIEKLGLFPVAVDAARGGAVQQAAAAAAAEKSGGAAPSSFASLMPASLRQAMNRKRKPKRNE
mgnify:CR=1 FL=1